MNNIYQKNMQYIKNINLSIYNKMLNLNVENVKVIRAKDNTNTLLRKFNENYISIHSRYNTKNQAKCICNYALEENPDIIFIIGMGLGYEAKEIIKKSNGKRCFIIEPDSEVFKTAMENIDITHIFNNNNNIYFIQDDNCHEVSKFFNSLVENDKKLNIKFIILPAYEIIYKEFIDNLMNNIKELLNIYRVNINTYTSSHRAWFQSFIINLKYLEEACPVTKLHSKFKSIPAIIVGAGPSLNYNLQHLKKVGDKAIIAPVGTGVSVLEKNKIRGHLLGAIDVWHDEERLFQNLDINKDSALFYSNMVCHPVPGLFRKNKFLMNTVEMDYFVQKKLGWQYYNIFSGASIANVIAYNLAQLGCSPIILLGQDFCYSNGKNYAEGATGYEDMTSEFEKKGYIKMKNVRGEDVYTTPSFIAMKQSIEFCIQLNPTIEFLNGNSMGLEIKGAKNIDFNEYVDNVFHNSESYNIDQIISSTYDEQISNMDKNLVNEFIHNVGNDITRIINICRECLKITQDNNSEKYKLEVLKNKEKQLSEIELYNYVVKSAVENIEYIYYNKNEIEKFKNMYAYILDKLLIMENAFKCEILEGENNG